MTQPARYDWIDAARGISIVLVVFYHAVVWLQVANVDVGGILPRINDEAIFRMPLFFLVAGLLAPKWMTRPWRKLFTGKIAFLIWPFLVWQVAVLAYKLLAVFVVPGYERGLFETVATFALSPLRPNGETWFLWALALYFVVCKVLWKIRPWVWITAALAVSVLWSQFFRADAPDSVVSALGPGLLNVAMYFFFFALGARFSPQIIATVSRIPIWAWGALSVAWIAWAVLSHHHGLYRVEIVEQIVGVAAGLGLARLLAGVKPLRVLGKQTLPIYLSHTLTIVVLISVLFAITPTVSGWAGTWLPLVLTAAGVAGGVLLHRIAGGSWLFTPPQWFLGLIRKTPHNAPVARVEDEARR